MNNVVELNARNKITTVEIKRNCSNKIWFAKFLGKQTIKITLGTGLVNHFVSLNPRNKIGMAEIKRHFRNKIGSQKVYSEVTLYPPPTTLPRFFPTFAKTSDPQTTQGCYFPNQGLRCSLVTRPPRHRNSCSFTLASQAGASH